MGKTPRKPTPAQQAALDEYARAFGKKCMTVSAPRASDGIIRIQAEAVAGTWQISIDTEGNVRYDCFTMRLLDDNLKPAPGVVTIDEYLKDVPDGAEVDGWMVEGA